MPKVKPRKKITKPTPKNLSKKPLLKASQKAKPVQEVEDDELVGEVDEFLDEDKPHERHPIKIRIGESIAQAQETEEVTDDDEVSPWEEAFAQGAEHQGEGAVCACCGKILADRDGEVIEREFNEEILFFCSEKCAHAGPHDQHQRRE